MKTDITVSLNQWNRLQAEHRAMRETLEHIANLASENIHSVQDGYAMIDEWSRNVLETLTL